MALRSLSLCAGIGGLDLGLRRWLECVCYVEREAFAASVLVGRMEEAALDRAPVWSDVGTFDARPWRGVVDCVVAGYPCQPFSQAGKRLGAADPRHLWPHVLRVLLDSDARIGFFENVRGHLKFGFDEVRADLERHGFRVEHDLFTAEQVGAPHKRARLFILAYADGLGRTFKRGGSLLDDLGPARGDDADGPRGPSASVGDPDLARLEGLCPDRGDPDERHAWPPSMPPGPDDYAEWARVVDQWPCLEPALCRVAHGVPDRVDRLRALGNAVHPDQAALAFSTLVERALSHEAP